MPAVSKAQQQAMGIAHAIQKGDVKPKAGTASAKIAKSMKPGEVKKYAETPRKGLPSRKENALDKLREFIRETIREVMAEESLEEGDYKVRGKLGTGTRFKNLVKSLAAKEGIEMTEADFNELEEQKVRDPAALAAWIGRKKYGKGKFQKLAAKGKEEDVAEAVYKPPIMTLDKWWKNDPDEVLRLVYWSKRQIPPSDPNKRKEAWKNLIPQLQKKFPAPSHIYKRMMGETITEQEMEEGYPKKHHGRRKLGSKKRRELKKRRDLKKKRR